MAKNSSSVTVHASMFQMGAFPPMCAKTGVPVSERKEVTATRTSPWAAMGLVGGVIGVLVLAVLLRKQLSGSVPLAPKSGPTPVQRSGYYVLGVAGVAFAAMFVLPGDAIGWAFLAFALFGIVGLGMVVVSSQFIRAELSADQQMVTLKNVDPTFAQATRAMMLGASNYSPTLPYGAVPQLVAPYQVAPAHRPLAPAGLPPAPQPAFSGPTPPTPPFGSSPAPSPPSTGSTVVDPFRS